MVNSIISLITESVNVTVSNVGQLLEETVDVLDYTISKDGLEPTTVDSISPYTDNLEYPVSGISEVSIISVALDESGDIVVDQISDSQEETEETEETVTKVDTASEAVSSREIESNDEYANLVTSGSKIIGQSSSSTDDDWYYLEV